MLMYCLGRARAELTSIQLGESPSMSSKHLLPANLQRFVDIDLSELKQPSEPLASEWFCERDRLHTSDNYSPVVNLQTISILYFAIDSIRRVFPQASKACVFSQALKDVNCSTSLASLAFRYGCEELDLAVNTDEYIGNRGWDWSCESYE